MSDVISTVRAAGLSLVASTLGSEWHELTHQIDPVLNPAGRESEKGYALIPEGASASEASNKQAFVYVQRFRLKLTREARINNKSEGTTLIPVLDDLFEKLHSVIIALRDEQMGANASVIRVGQPDISDPEYPQDRELIVMSCVLPVVVSVPFQA